MDHVVALAQTADGDPSIPSAVRDAARLLRETPAAPPPLITIGKPDISALEAATAIVDFARGRVGVSATSARTGTTRSGCRSRAGTGSRRRRP